MRPACIRCCWPSAASATRPIAERRRPQELLTTANAILGQGQLSLAKYLLIAAREDDPNFDVHDVAGIFRHVLERVDWPRDLHFQTCTTIDTLDYSGDAVNEGSKLVIAAVGRRVRAVADGSRIAATARRALGRRASVCRACWRCRVRAMRRAERRGRRDRTFCAALSRRPIRSIVFR